MAGRHRGQGAGAAEQGAGAAEQSAGAAEQPFGDASDGSRGGAVPRVGDDVDRSAVAWSGR